MSIFKIFICFPCSFVISICFSFNVFSYPFVASLNFFLNILLWEIKVRLLLSKLFPCGHCFIFACVDFLFIWSCYDFLATLLLFQCNCFFHNDFFFPFSVFICFTWLLFFKFFIQLLLFYSIVLIISSRICIFFFVFFGVVFLHGNTMRPLKLMLLIQLTCKVFFVSIRLEHKK